MDAGDIADAFPRFIDRPHVAVGVEKENGLGEGFGELALLYNCPRAATITALEESTVWRLDRDTFNNIVKDAA